MNNVGLVALTLVVTALTFDASARARPANGPVYTLTDLIESAGIKLPKGEELSRLIAAAEPHPLGSKLHPVRADSPFGQSSYLARLRCPDGKKPKFHRAFSAGIGPFGRMLDEYKVRCGKETNSVYLDMYHPGHVESRPVPGYSIRPPR